LNGVPSDRTQFCHPPCWHSFALLELPPPAADAGAATLSATPKQSATAALSARSALFAPELLLRPVLRILTSVGLGSARHTGAICR
jgi:hypothetical protein